MKLAIAKSYGKKGEAVVRMNDAAVDKGICKIVRIDVPDEWADAAEVCGKETRKLPDFVRKIMMPVNELKGDSLPVSAFEKREDGTVPLGTSMYDKRGTAVDIPRWNPHLHTQSDRLVILYLSSQRRHSAHLTDGLFLQRLPFRGM